MFSTAFLVKNVSIAVAVLGILFAAYSYGSINGSTTGYTKGVASQQAAIANLTKTINDERNAVATKIQQVQAVAANAVIEAQKQQTVKTVVRTQIVDHYNTVEKTVQAQCGLSQPSIAAINELLATQINYIKDATK